MNLEDFSTLTFDCYGTLIDWESGMVRALEPLTSRAKHPLSRDQILEAHARHESSQQVWTPAKRYSDLLAVVYKRLAEEWVVPTSWEECRAYGASVGDWPVFPDTVEALRYLKQHYRLVILSNVDNDSFARTNEKLGVVFDAIYTAEDIGSYKPSPRNFAYMLEKLATLGVGQGEILHTAESLFHDHGPANQAGLASCWIHRRHAAGGFGATMAPEEMPTFNFKFTSLGAFADAHRSTTRAGA